MWGHFHVPAPSKDSQRCVMKRARSGCVWQPQGGSWVSRHTVGAVGRGEDKLFHSFFMVGAL